MTFIVFRVFFILVLNILTIAYALPYGNSPRNVITVPPNCPGGQEWINGACRDVWFRAISPTSERKLSDIFWYNVITAPPNCPPGQEYINGQCRDVWRSGDHTKLSDIFWYNVITAPPNCPPGQEYINGQCRDVWRSGDHTKLSDISWHNVITAPPNCPPGQEYINGQCRDVWRGGDHTDSMLFNQRLQNLWNDYVRSVQLTRVQVEENSNVVANNLPRHIINVPNQCPIGYKADALGICRPIL